ncbi:histidine phosphatase family protein [bacterium]|nr:MAG: histidine phosphatase family protein [bacterium]MCL4231638.1 phosphoglycerate mutase family protein [Dehalococcoidia bacterium]
MPLILIRHGLASAGVDDLDPGLDPVGQKQAETTAEFLRGSNVGRLVVSPLRRTRETAQPLAEALGLAPELREEVAEVFDPAMGADERKAMIGPFMAGRWTGQPEPLLEWRKRVVRTLIELGIGGTASGHDVVVVTHYIAIGVAIGLALSDDRVVPMPVANCSITILEAGRLGLSLVAGATTPHLHEDMVTGVRTALPGGPA